MTPEQVTHPGTYLYKSVLSDEPVRVEVVDRGQGLYVRFEDRDDEDLLCDLTGSFERAA